MSDLLLKKGDQVNNVPTFLRIIFVGKLTILEPFQGTHYGVELFQLCPRADPIDPEGELLLPKVAVGHDACVAVSTIVAVNRLDNQDRMFPITIGVGDADLSPGID